MSLPVRRYPPVDMNAQLQKEKTIDVLVEQLAGLAEQKPVLIVFEDAHWADPTTLDLLSAMIGRIQNLRVLLVIAFRPEFESPWGSYNHVTLLSLNRLSRRHGAQIVEMVTEGKSLPDEVLDQIINKTDGVPLFLEELTKTVLEAGFTTGDQNLAVAASTAVIPATLQDSLMARLDRLESGKELAQIGACIGREFSYALIAAVAPADHSDLEDALARLIDAELLYCRGRPPNATYTFKHALVQDTAYQSLLKSRREPIHSRIAEALENQFREIVEAEPELLAHHYTEARHIEQAIPYWQKAGQRAVASSANAEAIGHFIKALDVMRTLPASKERNQQELALQIALGTAQAVTEGSGSPEVGSTLARADELCRELGDRSEHIDVLVGLWMFHIAGHSELTTTREKAEQVLQLARERDDASSLLKAYIAMATTLMDQGELPAVRRNLDRCCDFYDAEPNNHSTAFISGYELGVWARCYVAMTDWLLGYPAQATASAAAAVALAQELAHPHSLSRALTFAAWIYRWRGELSTACEFAEAAVTLSSENGFHMMWALGTIFHSAALADDGRGGNRIQEASDALALYRGTGMDGWMPYLLSTMAEIHNSVGQTDQASDFLREAFEKCRREKWNEAELYRLKGELMLQSSGDPPAAAVQQEAEACFHKALEIAKAQSARSWELRTSTSLARLWGQHGKRSEALQLLLAIYNWFTEGFETKDLQDAKALLEELA